MFSGLLDRAASLKPRCAANCAVEIELLVLCPAVDLEDNPISNLSYSRLHLWDCCAIKFPTSLRQWRHAPILPLNALCPASASVCRAAKRALKSAHGHLELLPFSTILGNDEHVLTPTHSIHCRNTLPAPLLK